MKPDSNEMEAKNPSVETPEDKARYDSIERQIFELVAQMDRDSLANLLEDLASEI